MVFHNFGILSYIKLRLFFQFAGTPVGSFQFNKHFRPLATQCLSVCQML